MTPIRGSVCGRYPAKSFAAPDFSLAVPSRWSDRPSAILPLSPFRQPTACFARPFEVMPACCERGSGLLAQEPTKDGGEPVGVFDLGQVPAVRYQFEGAVGQAGGGLVRLGGGKYPVALPPHHERGRP